MYFVPAIQADVSTVFFILKDPESIKQCLIGYYIVKIKTEGDALISQPVKSIRTTLSTSPLDSPPTHGALCVPDEALLFVPKLAAADGARHKHRTESVFKGPWPVVFHTSRPSAADVFFPLFAFFLRAKEFRTGA